MYHRTSTCIVLYSPLRPHILSNHSEQTSEQTDVIWSPFRTIFRNLLAFAAMSKSRCKRRVSCLEGTIRVVHPKKDCQVLDPRTALLSPLSTVFRVFGLHTLRPLRPLRPLRYTMARHVLAIALVASLGHVVNAGTPGPFIAACARNPRSTTSARNTTALRS